MQEQSSTNFSPKGDRVIFAVVEFDDGNTKDISTGVSYTSTDESIAKVEKSTGSADVKFKKLGYAELGASLQGCQMRRDFMNCEPEAGGGMSCPCECLDITLEVPGFFGLSPAPKVLVNQLETDEIVVVAWVDKTPITLPLGANFGMVLDLNDPIGCPVVVGEWAQGFPLYLVTQTDIDYGNAFLLRNSANSNPGISINPNSVKAAGDYRLFNRFKARVTSVAGQIQAYLVNGASAAVIGNTPNPCGSLYPSSSPENHSLNGSTGITSNGLRLFQLNQGRIGALGQSVDRTLNYFGQPVGSGTPWIWSAIKFNADGSPSLLDHQIFPTYYIYKNGQLIQTYPQSAASTFIALTSSSQRTLGQIN